MTVFSPAKIEQKTTEITEHNLCSPRFLLFTNHRRNGDLRYRPLQHSLAPTRDRFLHELLLARLLRLGRAVLHLPHDAFSSPPSCPSAPPDLPQTYPSLTLYGTVMPLDIVVECCVSFFSSSSLGARPWQERSVAVGRSEVVDSSTNAWNSANCWRPILPHLGRMQPTHWT